MEKWLQRYAETRDARQQLRQDYRRAHGGGKRSITYPPKLLQLPKDCSVDWLHDDMDKDESENGILASLDEWEYARGCETKVIKFICMHLKIFYS